MPPNGESSMWQLKPYCSTSLLDDGEAGLRGIAQLGQQDLGRAREQGPCPVERVAVHADARVVDHQERAPAAALLEGDLDVGVGVRVGGGVGQDFGQGDGEGFGGAGDEGQPFVAQVVGDLDAFVAA